MRAIARFVSVCTLLLIASLATAQKVDIMAGWNTLEAFSTTNDVVGFVQPQEKKGTYYSLSGDYVRLSRHRLGINVESSWRNKAAIYPFNGESYRPFFSDVNALYQPRIRKKFGLDVLAGVGVATTRFNVPASNLCNTGGAGCTYYTNSNHFMEDLGFGVRYYFWRRFFVRPEVHYYHIQNNVEFNSDNVYRVGGSLGYTFGPR